MEQIIDGALNIEEMLPMDLIKAHCKIDDLPGITNSQIELYRDAAMEAAEIYTRVKWFHRIKITEPIVSPRFRSIAQAAIARLTIELNYAPINGIVNIYGTGDTPLFWLNTIPIRPDRHHSHFSIVLPAGATKFELSNDLLFVSLNGCEENRHGMVQQQGARIEYIAGIKCEKDVPAGIKLGCLKFIAWSIENPGDQFVPMVIRQVGVTTVTNNPTVSSGAIDEWRKYKKIVAR